MGLFCQIHIHKPEGGVYRSGDELKGIIKYAVSDKANFKRITVLLYGYASCHWTEGTEDTNNDSMSTRKSYSNYENLYTIESRLIDNETEFAIGSYQAPFHFIIPPNVPSTYKDFTAKIQHYVKVKFEKPGMFSFNSEFKTEICVKGNAMPTQEIKGLPIIYGEQKKFTGFLSRKSGVVNIKAVVNKPYVQPGEQIDVDCEITNTSPVPILASKISLKGKLTYTASCGHEKTSMNKVGDCKSTFTEMDKENFFRIRPHFTTPLDIYPIQHTKVMKREYFLVVEAKVPSPRWNVSLSIPIDVEEAQQETKYVVEEYENIDDQPPSYWEAMGEVKPKQGSYSEKPTQYEEKS